MTTVIRIPDLHDVRSDAAGVAEKMPDSRAAQEATAAEAEVLELPGAFRVQEGLNLTS